MTQSVTGSVPTQSVGTIKDAAPWPDPGNLSLTRSFPRSAWECSPGRSASVTQSVTGSVPTQSVGTIKDAAPWPDPGNLSLTRSFPRSAWECSPGRSASVTQSVTGSVPTQSVGTISVGGFPLISKKPSAIFRSEISENPSRPGPHLLGTAPAIAPARLRPRALHKNNDI